MRFSALVPRITKTAAVAHTSAPSMKNCHGRSESDVGCVGDKGLVEVFELTVEPRLQCGVVGVMAHRSQLRGRRRAARPLRTTNTPATAPKPPMGVGEQPREAVEPLSIGAIEQVPGCRTSR